MRDQNSKPFSFPRIGQNQVVTLAVQSADFTIHLSSDLSVLQATAAQNDDLALCADWAGKPLQDLVSTDSLAKLENMFADNAADPDCEGRWRHLNFDRQGADPLPLLLKFFVFETETGDVNIIIGRDLRPVLGTQKMLQRELNRLERERQSLSMRPSNTFNQ